MIRSSNAFAPSTSMILYGVLELRRRWRHDSTKLPCKDWNWLMLVRTWNSSLSGALTCVLTSPSKDFAAPMSKRRGSGAYSQKSTRSVLSAASPWWNVFVELKQNRTRTGLWCLVLILQEPIHIFPYWMIHRVGCRIVAASSSRAKRSASTRASVSNFSWTSCVWSLYLNFPSLNLHLHQHQHQQGVRLAVALFRFGPLFFLCLGIFYAWKCNFPWNHRMEKRAPKHTNFCLFGAPFAEKNDTRHEIVW